MTDLAFYLTAATIFATVMGGIVGLISAIVGGWVQRKQLKLQEVQGEQNLESINMSAATQWVGVGIQHSVQTFNQLQDCMAARELQANREDALRRANTSKDLKLQTVVAKLNELLVDHNNSYNSQGISCSFFDTAQEHIQYILDAIKEEVKEAGNG